MENIKENFGLNLNKVKQPKPDIENSSNKNQRVIQNPYVGIISEINPTSTPLSDTLYVKGQEIPRIKFNPFKNKLQKGLFNFNNFATGGIITCAILALISLIKKK